MEILTQGERILLERHRARMTKKELAEMVGVSPATITKYENDEAEPNPDILLAIATSLNTTCNKIKFGFHTPDDKTPKGPLIKN